MLVYLVVCLLIVGYGFVVIFMIYLCVVWSFGCLVFALYFLCSYELVIFGWIRVLFVFELIILIVIACRLGFYFVILTFGCLFGILVALFDSFLLFYFVGLCCLFVTFACCVDEIVWVCVLVVLNIVFQRSFCLGFYLACVSIFCLCFAYVWFWCSLTFVLFVI